MVCLHNLTYLTRLLDTHTHNHTGIKILVTSNEAKQFLCSHTIPFRAVADNSELIICDVKDQSKLDLGEIVTRPGRVARTTVTIRSESRSLETRWNAQVDSDSGVKLSQTSGILKASKKQDLVVFVSCDTPKRLFTKIVFQNEITGRTTKLNLCAYLTPGTLRIETSNVINLGTISTHGTLVSRDIRLRNLTSQVMSSVRLVDSLMTDAHEVKDDKNEADEKEESSNIYDIVPGTNMYV